MNTETMAKITVVALRFGPLQPRVYDLGQGEVVLSLNVPLPNSRHQEVMIFESNGYLIFVSQIKSYSNMESLQAELNLEAILRANYKIREGSFAITDIPAQVGGVEQPTLVFIASQNAKTADLEEIENKIASAAKHADELEKITSGGLDSF